MKKIVTTASLALIFLTAISQNSEVFFKFIEHDKNIINTTLTRTISIEGVNHDTVYAYANADDLRKFEKLGYKYTLLPKSSLLNTKTITMATRVDQMTTWDKYPTYSVYRAMMKKYEQDYPTLCKLDSLGTTNNNHKIYVVKLSDNVAAVEPEVEVFYTSTMHGDETTGFVLMLRLIDYLLSNYPTDVHIASMLNSMAIYINPIANPDGTYYGGDNTVSGATRSNYLGVNLNRNFPDPRFGIHPDGHVYQAETQIMMDFASSRHFTQSANFHGGAEVVNYPWDAWTSSMKTHPDNSWYRYISRQYADSAHANSPVGYFDDLENGITNGGDWYVISGGRQDYMNWWHHCREVTIELSSDYILSSDLLPNLWNYNRAALLAYLESATKGFNGIVKNAAGNPVKAKVFISDHDADSSFVYSSSVTGFYARPIEPGTWQVTYSAYGYISQTKTISVADWSSSVVQDVVLEIDPDIDPDVNAPVDQNINNPLSVWPNPFSDDISISFSLDKPSYINLSVYSIDGRKIITIANGIYHEGFNTTRVFSLSNSISAGSYVVVLRVGEKSFTQIIQHIP